MAADFVSEYLPAINLAHYYPQKRSGNTVRYVHKKFLKPPKNEKNPTPKPSKIKTERQNNNTDKTKVKKKKKGVTTDDKSIQFNSEPQTQVWKDSNPANTNDSVLGQTITFAKNIVPLTIPFNSNDSASSVYYTVKVSQKSNKRQKNNENSEARDVTFKKEKNRRIVETYRNEKVCSQRESLSVKETVSFGSQNNTLDEIHNPSLCCSLSEISEKKLHKKDKIEKRAKHSDTHKLVASNSFEALATELVNNSGEAKVKIHLMKEADKNILVESIKEPLIKVLKEYFNQSNEANSALIAEINTAQKLVTCNTERLDNVVEKLTSIERKIDDFNMETVAKLTCIEKQINELAMENANATIRKPQVYKVSTLESLGQDLSEVKEEGEDSSERECYEEDITERRKNREKSAIVHLRSKIIEKDVENAERRQAGGEEGSTSRFETNQLLAKLERPNRIPARFCWTDAGRKS